MSVLFIQPWDRPWHTRAHVRARTHMYIARAPFEIASCLPNEVPFALLDCNLALKQGATLARAVRSAVAHAPKLVCISWPTYVVGRDVMALAALAKKYSPTSFVLVGGAALTLVHDVPLRTSQHIDACYVGRGHEIHAIYNLVLKHESLDGVSGVYTRTCTKPIPAKSTLPTYDSTAEVYDRVNFAAYVDACRAVHLTPLGILEMTRGCMHTCFYCAINKHRVGFTHRSAVSVATESRYFAQHGVVHQHLIDPTFGLHKSGARELLALLREVKHEYPRLTLEVLTRPELVSPSFATSLRHAGVTQVALGMETMDRDTLRSASKTLAPTTTERAVHILAATGIRTKLFHMLFPRICSLETLRFFVRLYRSHVPFILQSSFYRTLPTAASCGTYVEHDQTVYNPSCDSSEQLIEWLFANLGFPSMDIGTTPREDVIEILEQAQSLDDIKKHVRVSRSSTCVRISTGTRRYEYVHPKQPRAVAECLYTVERG